MVVFLDEMLVSGLPNYAVAMFNLDQEQAFGTWYSSVLLALGGTLSFAMAAARTVVTRYWKALGVMLWIFSADEAVRLHERSALGIRPQGPLMFAWVVPGTILVIGLGVWFLVRFFPRLPQPIRARTIVAAAVYVFGALGLEFLEGSVASGMIFGVFGERSLNYQVIALVQESLEMVGLVLFSSALLAELRDSRSLMFGFE